MQSTQELNEAVKNTIADMFRKELSRKGLKLDTLRSDLSKNRIVFVSENQTVSETKTEVILELGEENLIVDSTTIPYKDCKTLTSDLELLLGPPIKSTDKPPKSSLSPQTLTKRMLDAQNC